jgi:hypothetical protein
MTVTACHLPPQLILRCSVGTDTGFIMGNDWDARPRAEKGDETPDCIFHAVGAALTAWERLESILAELFDLLLASGNRAAFKV